MGHRRRSLRSRPQVPLLDGTTPHRLCRGRAAQPSPARRRVRHRTGGSARRPGAARELETALSRQRRQGTTTLRLGRGHRPDDRRAHPRTAGPADSSSAVRSPPLERNPNWPTTCAAPPPPLQTRNWCASPAHAGPSRSASRPPRPKSVSITTRSDAMTPGIATSRSPCSPTPTSPSPPQCPQKAWPRPHPAHPRRNPSSPGTSDPHRAPMAPDPGLVTLAPTPPTPRQDQPLPAKTQPTSRSAAGVLM